MLRAIAFAAILSALPAAAQAQNVQLNVVQESLELRPADIESAEAKLVDGRWVVMVELAPGAAAMFGAITGRSIGKAMQIVSGDRILSAPIIRDAITRGSLHIEGSFTETSAKDLAAKLKP